MSARDDYPLGRVSIGVGTDLLALPGVLYTMDPAQWKDMCDEIDALRVEVDLHGSTTYQADPDAPTAEQASAARSWGWDV